MRSGKLRQRVLLQSLQTGQDTFGQPLRTWNDVATVWARVSPVTGREVYSAKAEYAQADMKIEMRYRSGVKAAMRAVHDGTIYNIKAVLDFDERHTDILLLCERGVNDG